MVLNVYKMLFSVNANCKTDFFMILTHKITFILIITLLSIIMGVDHSPILRKKLLAIAFNYFK